MYYTNIGPWLCRPSRVFGTAPLAATQTKKIQTLTVFLPHQRRRATVLITKLIKEDCAVFGPSAGAVLAARDSRSNTPLDLAASSVRLWKVVKGW